MLHFWHVLFSYLKQFAIERKCHVTISSPRWGRLMQNTIGHTIANWSVELVKKLKTGGWNISFTNSSVHPVQVEKIKTGGCKINSTNPSVHPVQICHWGNSKKLETMEHHNGKNF